MTSNKLLALVYLAILGTAGFSLLSLAERYRVESRNHAVELLVEMESAKTLAATQNLTLSEAIDRLKSAGVGAVVLSEQTVGELIDTGKLQFQPRIDGQELTLVGNEESIARLARGYWIRFGKEGTPPPDFSQSKNAFIVQSHTASLIRTIDVGLDPEAAALAKEKGLRIYARGGNPLGADRAAVKGAIAWLSESGASVFLPEGEQVLGRRSNLETLKESLLAHDMLYASPEFAKLGGDLNMVVASPERVIRLHSAQAAELDKMTLPEAVERYVRAGRERNIRALLLRPLEFSAEFPFDAFQEFVEKVANRLRKEGGAVGPAKVFEAPDAPRWVFPAIGVCAAIVAFYAATLFFTNLTWLGFLGVLCVAIGGGAWLPELRNYTSLMAALAFPLAAFGLLEAHRHRIVAIHYLMMVLVSLVGGLAVGGLLNALPYFVRAEQFEGVKLAHFLPIFLAGFYMAARLVDWRGGLKNPVSWLQAFLAIFILVALAFMFARTGNDNPAAVSGLEMKLRSLLDNILPVRPRTKEFLFGYPALIIGLGLLMRTRSEASSLGKGWAALALMVGTIALTSVVNSMCHLHTPLDVGLLRITVGFVLGGIIGAVAWMVLRHWLPKPGT